MKVAVLVVLVAVLAVLAAWYPRLDLNGMASDLIAEIERAFPGKYPDLRRRVRDVRPFPLDRQRPSPRPGKRPMVRRGWYDRGEGVVYVSATSASGRGLALPVVAGVLVHEMAHAALSTGDHGNEWRAVYEDFLHVATARLGWDVALERSSCKLYGLCDQDQCPLCTW